MQTQIKRAALQYEEGNRYCDECKKAEAVAQFVDSIFRVDSSRTQIAPLTFNIPPAFSVDS